MLHKMKYKNINTFPVGGCEKHKFKFHSSYS